jgi:hypothetical protein
VQDPGKQGVTPPCRTKTLADHFGVTAAPADQRIFSTIFGRLKLGAFEELLVDWVTHDNLPFRIIESERLRRLIEFVNPMYKGKIPSAAVLRSRLRSIYEGAKGAVTEHLKTARGKVHITFDGWTSRNQLSLLGVNCFFVDQQWQHRRLLLALPPVCGRHTGDNLANEVADVLAEWGLGRDQLGYMVLDNASNNDTAVAALGAELGFDPGERRLRCLGHVLNLAVKQLMFGEAANAMEHASDNEQDSEDHGDARLVNKLIQWRRRGPVGRLHNLNAAILNSSQHIECLLKWQEEDLNSGVLEFVDPETGKKRVPVKPVADNDTRWNSRHRMMARALLLREYFNRVVEKAERAWERSKRRSPKPSILDDKLSEEDWDVIEAFIQVLRPFDEISVRLQGNPKTSEVGHAITGSFWEYFPSFEYLLTHLEEFKQSHDLVAGLGENSAAMVTSHINLAWMKLNEYYNKLWPVAYVGAVVLHPCYGWPAIRHHWEGHTAATGWEKDYSARLMKMWKDEYADREIPTSPVIPTACGRRAASGYDAFLAQSLGKRNRMDTGGRVGNGSAPLDEYERYMQTFTPADDRYQFSPICWWREHQVEYPNLSRMATDLLSIPTMSAETERSFSSAGKMVSSLRTRLDRHTIGMAQGLRSWSREGIVLPSW